MSDKEDLLNLLEYKFEELNNIFHNLDSNERDEYQNELYEAYFNIGKENIDIIKFILEENILTENEFKFDKNYRDKLIQPNQYYETLYDFIWDLDELNIENKDIQLPSQQYYDKLKNGFNAIQKETIESIKNDNFQNGIVCIATGGGKSLIILNIIDYFNNNLLDKNRCILIFTERKNILLDLFFKYDNNKKEYIKNEEYWDVWNKLNIINMDNFNLINLVSNKDKNWTDFQNNNDNNKTNLIIINRVFLTNNKRYENIKKEFSPQLVIYDECQGITANTSFKFLDHAKNQWESNIIGFSATPIRRNKTNSIQKQGNLNKIFNINEEEKKLKIYQNYNILSAINDDICSKLNFVWYKLDKKINNKKERFANITKDDVKNCLKILISNIDNLYYKKIICWCSTIDNADLYKEYYIKLMNEDLTLGTNEFEKIKNIIPYVDHSSKSDEYKNFYDTMNNAILFCVGKHREGSDIPYLDCGMFLDRVENRSDVVWIQSVGRIARRAINKDFGLIIDTYYERENENEHEAIIEKLIGYYVLLDSLTIENGINKREMYEKAKKDIQLNNDEKLIHMSNFDIICQGINWSDFALNFNHIFDSKLQKKIKMNGNERLEIICQILKDELNWNENTDFWSEYKLIDKSKYEEFPEDIYNEFKTIFEKKTWYDILKFDKKYFKNIEDVQIFFERNDVYDINNKIYEHWTNIENKLPKNPDEYFRLDQKYTNVSSLLKTYDEENTKIIF